MACSDLHRTLDAVWRIESARIIGTLARMVRDVGIAEELAQDALVAACRVPVRDLMRSKEAIYAELGLDNAALDDEALIAAIAAHPVLLNRPIVVTPLGAKLCRPPDTVLSLLPAAAA